MSNFLHKCNGNCTLFMVLLIAALCLLLYKCYNKSCTKEEFAQRTAQTTAQTPAQTPAQTTDIIYINIITTLPSIQDGSITSKQTSTLLTNLSSIQFEKLSVFQSILLSYLLKQMQTNISNLAKNLQEKEEIKNIDSAIKNIQVTKLPLGKK